MNDQIERWAPRVGRERACVAFGVSPRTWRDRRQCAQGPRPRPSRASGLPRQAHPARIPDDERGRIRELLCSQRFCDLAPAQVYATLLDGGAYHCSIRQMYRILHEAGLVAERRAGHVRKNHTKPVVSASRPNQVWTWDISRLAGPSVRSWFYLYVVIDIFSRSIVAWSVDSVESDKVARRMIKAATKRQGIDPNCLTLHSDRGAQMTSNSMAELLEELGVTRSLSRPRVSNDNPYSESNFKTAKYHPGYPKRFAALGDARSWARRFVHWYNHVHYHSAIGLLHPAELHAGNGAAIRTERQAVLNAAFKAHPERFFNKAPVAPTLPASAWINKPTIRTELN
ncbi:MAG: IS3 family transposase [Pseudonocardiaceae bacterium]